MTWTAEQVRDGIAKNDTMVERCLMLVYRNQTADEKSSKMTKHENGVGFNGTDAVILSSFAEWIKKGAEKKIPEGKRLSHKQREMVRAKLPKYAAQIAKTANAVLAAKQTTATA